MKAKRSTGSPIWIVTIHDQAAQGYAAVDIKDILSCLGPSALRYVWVVTELDCTGAEAQSLCDAVAKHRGEGIALSGEELWAASQKFGQTIDATMAGAPPKDYRPEELIQIADSSRFPESQAQLVIRAIDGSFFEVIAKDRRSVELLKSCFRDVRDEDVSHYFPVLGKS